MEKLSKRLKAIALLHIFIILLGCSKDEPATIYDKDPSQQENGDSQDPGGSSSDDQEPVLYDNVVSILDEKSDIISSEEELANGLYIFEFSENPPQIEVNDIIVGGEGYGFIRRVSSISTDGNIVNILTTSANLKDIFKSGKIEFTTETSQNNYMDSSRKSNKPNNGNEFREEYSFDLTHYDWGPNFKLTKGRATFNPNLGPIVVEYDGSQTREMTFNNDNLILTTELDFTIESGSSTAYRMLSQEDPIIYVYPNEILGLEFDLVVTVEFITDFNLIILDEFRAIGGVTNTTSASLATGNNNATWNSNNSYDVNTSSNGVYLEKPAYLRQDLTIIARVTAEVNLLPALYLQADAVEEFYVNYNKETGDWDSALSAGLNFNYGIYGEIFGIEYDFSENPYNYRKTLWYGPANLKIDSGNDQTGVYFGVNETNPLDEPLKVSVIDNFGRSLGNVWVHYLVTSGGGSLGVPNAPTGVEGFAVNDWTLGNESEDQTVEVTIRKADGDLIGDSPLEFNAAMIDLSGDWIIINTSSNCPQGVYYRFSFNPSNNSINILGEDTSEITSTGFEFDIEDLSLVIHITSEEELDYYCDVDENFYYTTETGDAVISGYYSNGEFTGEYNVSFTELPINPCVYNFSCSDTFRIYKD